MVVDDEPLIRMALAAALEDEGYCVFEAGTVLQAIAVLSKQKIHAVITDVDMPGGLSGLDLADAIAGFSRTMTIIVTSGRSVQIESDLPSGAIFFAKPYELSSLIDTLGCCLSTHPIASTG